MLLYCAYQAQCDALAPVRFFADAARGLLDQPWPGIGALPLVRGAAASLNLFSHTRLSHERAPFRSEEHTSELQSHHDLVCRLVLEKNKLQRLQAGAMRRHLASDPARQPLALA